jgi:hypothetical protein
MMALDRDLAHADECLCCELPTPMPSRETDSTHFRCPRKQRKEN